MKKKVILGITIGIIILTGIIAAFIQIGNQDLDKNFAVAFTKDYAEVGQNVKVKVNGAKKKKCSFEWYIDDNRIEGIDSDTYEIHEEDAEKLLEVVVNYKDKEEKASMYISNLPVMKFSLKGSIGENYEECDITMQSSENYKNTDTYNGKGKIKLRGNSTLWRDKKPYRLELEEKTNLLGLGKAKDWVLLAEDIDHTLVRNRLVMYFADSLGLKYTSKATSVVVMVNEKYQGVYTLIEQVRIGKDQVDITDYKDIAEKLARKIVIEDAVAAGVVSKTEALNSKSMKELLATHELLNDANKLENQLYQKLTWLSKPYEVTYNNKVYNATEYVEIPDLTGGFLLEADFYHSRNSYDSVATAFLQPFYFNSPERAWTNTELKEYTQKYLQTFEYALHSEDFTYHEKDTHYKADSGKFNIMSGWNTKESVNQYSDKKRDSLRYDDMFDMDSLVNYFLVTEFARNWDSMKNSVFIYKDVDEKACIGPVWDYDWAFGNINMYSINTNFPEGWNTTDYYFTNEQLYQNYNWYRYMIKDKVFVDEVYRKYKEIRPTLIEDMIKEGGLLDQWKDELSKAGEANDARWRYTYRAYRSHGYETSWNELKAFIEKRVKWLDEQFKDEETLYESLNSYRQYKW